MVVLIGRTNTPRYVVLLVIVGTILLAAFAINRVYSYAICTPVLRGAISSFSHYDGLEVAPKPNLGYDSCQVSYEVRYSEGNAVTSYYESKLRDHGWRRPDSNKLYVEGRGAIMFDPRLTYGIKDGLVYEIEVDRVEKRFSTATPQRPTTWVNIHVSSLTD